MFFCFQNEPFGVCLLEECRATVSHQGRSEMCRLTHRHKASKTCLVNQGETLLKDPLLCKFKDPLLCKFVEDPLLCKFVEVRSETV